MAASLPTTLLFPAPIGYPASTNAAIAGIDRSGAGKGITAAAAKDVLRLRDYIDRDLPLSTGEGITEAFMGDIDNPDGAGRIRGQKFHNVMMMCPEGEKIVAISRRSGATTWIVIRQAIFGEQLGEQNASAERTRIIEAHAYSLGLVIMFQHENAAEFIVGEQAGGTSNRFIYGSMSDPGAPRYPGPHPGPLDWTPPARTAEPVQMTCDDSITEEIRDYRWREQTEQIVTGAYATHERLNRLKVSGWLRLLHDSSATHITADDWHLAGLIMQTSNNVRDSVLAKADHAEAERRESRVRQKVDVAARSAVAVVDATTNQALRTCAVSAGRYAHKRPGQLLKRKQLKDAMSGTKLRECGGVADALKEACEVGYLSAIEGGWCAGPSQP